jgi:hypothetical protein
MGASLHEADAVEHEDLGGVTDRREAVGDDDRDPPGHGRGQASRTDRVSAQIRTGSRSNKATDRGGAAGRNKLALAMFSRPDHLSKLATSLLH